MVTKTYLKPTYLLTYVTEVTVNCDSKKIIIIIIEKKLFLG